jgi:hypothetical protein
LSPVLLIKGDVTWADTGFREITVREFNGRDEGKESENRI